MSEKFSIEICSDLDYKGMVVDISYDMQNIASINYDKGIDNIEIEVLPNKGDGSRFIIPLDDFFNILEKAKKLAIKCAKEDELRNK
jgi:hypothetical protein